MVLSWETLQRFNINSPPTYTLGRSKEVQEIYDKHRKWMKTSKLDIKSYITKKFNLEENGIVFVENEFPYNCEDSIKHFVIWISDTFTYNLKFLDQFIQKKIKTKYTDSKYIFYKNIPQNNSIGCVNHYHVFVNTNC